MEHGIRNAGCGSERDPHTAIMIDLSATVAVKAMRNEAITIARNQIRHATVSANIPIWNRNRKIYGYCRNRLSQRVRTHQTSG